MYYAVLIILSILNSLVLSFYCQKYFHILQLKGYKIKKFMGWYFNSQNYITEIIFAASTIIFNFIINFANLWVKNIFFSTLGAITYFVCVVLISRKKLDSKQTKVQFVKTPRVIRLYVTFFIVNVVICFFTNVWFKNINFLQYTFVPINFTLFTFLIASAKIINVPFEKIINSFYIEKSKNKLKQMPNLIKIGITGSAGKTSVKNILDHILSIKYKVFSTPHSYNTPLGICRSINENMSLDSEIFVAELGAKQKNDITSLCKYLEVDLGIVTSISKQHILTFKNIENIYLTKKELPDYLNEKLCVYNFDDNLCKKMYENKNGKKCGVSIQNNDADIFASDIKIEDFVTHFNLHFKNKSYEVVTKLLGKHNVTNILLATALAIHFYIKIEDIVEGIKTIEPTPHRLQYIQSNGINILDDSFNCSPISAENALEVLASCPTKKIVCTPGIIEGGDEQYQINYDLAQKLNIVADTIIIVGKTNKKSFVDGLCKDNNIFYVNNLSEAQQLFAKLLNENDTLLILNDLPDDYD